VSHKKHGEDEQTSKCHATDINYKAIQNPPGHCTRALAEPPSQQGWEEEDAAKQTSPRYALAYLLAGDVPI